MPRQRSQRTTIPAAELRLARIVLGLLLAAGAWWAAAVISPPQPHHDDYHIVLNLFQQRLYLFDDGEKIRTLPIAVARQGSPPPGEYPVVRRMIFDVHGPGTNWRLGTHFLGLAVPGDPVAEDGLRFGLHGVPLVPDVTDEQPGSATAGRPVDSGQGGTCVALANAHMAELHDMTPAGTTVYVYWGLPWHDIFHSLPFRHPASPARGAAAGCIPPVITVEVPDPQAAARLRHLDSR